MPHDITETPQYTVGPIELPNNGEVDGIESIEGAFQELMNRGATALLATAGRMAWSGDFAVNRGGSLTSFTIVLGAVQVAELPDDTGAHYDPYSYAGGNVTQTKVEGGGGTLGAVKQWWYVYALPGSSNVLDFEVSTTAPRAHRVYKSPAIAITYARRYVGCFPTTSAGAPIPVTATRGCYRYRDRAAASFLHQNQTTADLNTFTSALSLADLVPPHARIAIVRLQLVRTGSGGDAAASIRVNGDTNPAATVTVPGLALLFPADHFIEMDVGASREVQVSTNGSGTLVNVDVAGWRE